MIAAWLQTVTLDWGSDLLDFLRMPHVVVGQTVHTPGSEVPIPETFGSVAALGVMLAAALVLALWRGRRIWHTGFLLFGAVYWILVLSVLHAVAVVCCAVRFDVVLTGGWRRLLLDAGTWLAAALLLWATDRLLAVCGRWLPGAWADEVGGAPPTRFKQVCSRFVVGPMLSAGAFGTRALLAVLLLPLRAGSLAVKSVLARLGFGRHEAEPSDGEWDDDPEERRLGWLRFQPPPWVLNLLASPALLVGLLVPGVVLYESQGLDDETPKLYERLVNIALDRRNVPAAKAYLAKLESLDARSADARYARARLAELEGDRERAARLMNELAPADAAGHPRAHFWLAVQMLRRDGKRTDSDTRLLMHHLNVATDSPHERQAAHVVLADLHRAQGDLAAAVRHLESVILDRPEMRLPLSTLYEEIGDELHARQQRERAIEIFRRAAERNKNNIHAAILWSRTLDLADNPGRAEKVLLASIAAQEGQTDEAAKQRLTRLRQALADHYVAAFDRLTTDGRSDLKQRLPLLQRALVTSPDHAGALNRIAALLHPSNPESRQVRTALKELVAGTEVPPAVRLLLGTAAATGQDWPEAIAELEKASEQLPQMPVLLNNLAWTLASADPPQLDRALSMAHAAAKLWPVHPEIRETRGVILFKLERWKEAVVDLEAALAAFPDRPHLHEHLADVYEHLGDQALAERHRRKGKDGG